MLTDDQLPPLPKCDVFDPNRFGVAWREASVRAYGRLVEAATLATVTPLVQQREPMFYTVFCLADHQGAPLALPQYSHQHESGVLDLVLAGARREGFEGTAAERMAALGWRVGPVYA